MSDLRTHTHARGTMTEVLAFEKSNKVSKSIKAKILEELEQAGEVGLTPDEFVEMHGGLINTIRRRFTDLWKDGQIRHHPEGRTRKNPAGNACVTWVLGADPMKKPLQRSFAAYETGFQAGVSHVIAEIERWVERHDFEPRVTGPILTLLQHLKSESNTQ